MLFILPLFCPENSCCLIVGVNPPWPITVLHCMSASFSYTSQKDITLQAIIIVPMGQYFKVETKSSNSSQDVSVQVFPESRESEGVSFSMLIFFPHGSKKERAGLFLLYLCTFGLRLFNIKNKNSKNEHGCCKTFTKTTFPSLPSLPHCSLCSF